MPEGVTVEDPEPGREVEQLKEDAEAEAQDGDDTLLDMGAISGVKIRPDQPQEAIQHTHYDVDLHVVAVVKLDKSQGVHMMGVESGKHCCDDSCPAVCWPDYPEHADQQRGQDCQEGGGVVHDLCDGRVSVSICACLFLILERFKYLV